KSVTIRDRPWHVPGLGSPSALVDRSGAAGESALEPHLRYLPIALNRAAGHAEGGGNLLRLESTEKAKLGDTGHSFVDVFEACEGAIEREDLQLRAARESDVDQERYGFLFAAALGRTAPARMVHEHLTHGTNRNPVEVGP